MDNDSLKKIIQELDNSIKKESKAIEKENWELVNKIIADNEKKIKKLLKKKIETDQDKKLIMEIGLKAKKVEELLKEKIEKMKQGIASLQNTSSNLDNLLSTTDQPSYFIDEKK